MAILTKSGEVYECGIKEENEEKVAEPVFRKIETLKEILQIAIVNGTNLIAISNHEIYCIGYPGIPNYKVKRQINDTIKQMSSESLNIAYVTNNGDVYLLGDSFWEHDPTFDSTIPKKLNGIENAEEVYSGPIVYVIKNNEIYIITGVNLSWGIK